MDIGVILKENNMKPINFVGPIKHVEAYSFTKRAYAFEADMEGERKLELQILKGMTLPPKKWVGIYNSDSNIAGH